MLPARYVAFFVFVWVVGSFFGAVMEQGFLGPGEQGVLNTLTSWQMMNLEQPWGIFQIPGAVFGFFGAIFNMLTFNFKFLAGSEWTIFKWIVLAPLSALAIYGLITTLIGLFSRSL